MYKDEKRYTMIILTNSLINFSYSSPQDPEITFQINFHPSLHSSSALREIQASQPLLLFLSTFLISSFLKDPCSQSMYKPSISYHTKIEIRVFIFSEISENSFFKSPIFFVNKTSLRGGEQMTSSTALFWKCFLSILQILDIMGL